MAKITVQLSDEQHRRYSAAKFDFRQPSLQALIISAMEQLIASKAAQSPRPDSTENKQPPAAPSGNTDVKSITVLETGQREEVTAEEWRWVERVLGVVRGAISTGDRRAADPLDKNLDAFVLMNTFLTREASATSHGVPLADSGQSTENLEKTLESVRRNKEDLGRRMEELGLDRETDPGEGTSTDRTRSDPGDRGKGHHGRPGGRS